MLLTVSSRVFLRYRNSTNTSFSFFLSVIIFLFLFGFLFSFEGIAGWLVLNHWKGRVGEVGRRLMHLVPAPAVRLMKRRVLSRPGPQQSSSFSSSYSWACSRSHLRYFSFNLILFYQSIVQEFFIYFKQKHNNFSLLSYNNLTFLGPGILSVGISLFSSAFFFKGVLSEMISIFLFNLLQIIH